jgi:hypothetical protein
MSVVAARQQSRRRSGRRLLLTLLAITLAAGGGLVWLEQVAQAAVDAPAVLTVYQPVALLETAGSVSFSAAATGALVRAGDSVQTDSTGRASLVLPDGSITRLAGDTQLKLNSSHFTRDGNLHDTRWFQQIGRTLTRVQHLASGATFQVVGQSAVASVRGTTFEVLVAPDGSMTVKLFDGTLDFHGKNDVTLSAGQQATADAQGNIGSPVAIVADPSDPFGPQLGAADAAANDTTPGTEEDFVGAPLHDGEQQKYAYFYAGGPLVKAVLGYPGSAMTLTVTGPDGSQYDGKGPSPVAVSVKNAPAGMYTILVSGTSGLGVTGEEPFLAVASVEDCASADTDLNGAVHRGYSAQDLEGAVRVAGLSNLNLSIIGSSLAGAIVSGSGTYNGVGWGGTIVLVNRAGAMMIVADSAAVFGVHVPATQILQQIGAAAGQDPSMVSPGFTLDRLFTCKSILIIDGHHG